MIIDNNSNNNNNNNSNNNNDDSNNNTNNNNINNYIEYIYSWLCSTIINKYSPVMRGANSNQPTHVTKRWGHDICKLPRQGRFLLSYTYLIHTSIMYYSYL